MNLPMKTTAPSMLMDPHAFEHMQRVGSMLALSPLFPDHLRKGSKETAIANGVLVMNMAARLNEDPLTVAQNIYFVSGKPGWSASYMIGKANQHGVFKNPISWDVTGEKESLSVTAFAELAATGKRVQITCDMQMAKAEGWTKNSKYQSMPEQMLRYRSATFLIRLYCPEVMVGIPSTVEVELGGMKDVTPIDYAAATAAAQEKPAPEPEDAEIVEEAKPSDKDSDPKINAAAKVDGQKEPEQSKAETEKPKPRDDAAIMQTLDAIKGDLMDAGADNVESVLDFYRDQVEELERNAPDLHKDLQEYIEQVKKGAEA